MKHTVSNLQSAAGELYQVVGVLLYDLRKDKWTDQDIAVMDLLSWMSGNQKKRPSGKRILPFRSVRK